MNEKKRAVILIQCPDKKGIVARVSDYLFRNGANIIQSDQYSTDPEGGTFFMRIEFYYDAANLDTDRFVSGFSSLASDLAARWHIHYFNAPLRMGILVSKEAHCLADILYRWKTEELSVGIPFIISNHEDHAALADHYRIPYHYIPATVSNRPAAEKEILGMIKAQTDFIVLARYMQILSADFLSYYGKDVINIHHSFLPSFKGANPYRQAHERGVKIIGATAHFVTPDLDEGPIIEQLVERVSHRDGVDTLVRKGRNLEKVAFARAIQLYTEQRVIRFKNKTVVFE